ncbi:hypothetical protein [Pedobacter sp. SYSU D00535]|uniref:hypothetical protein n=1 Tax=Pedobacter sp. SYSU D00535 TaxID=2810308 RepID=UPI001A969E37|nr:hypothetical protein [Pedobacter sp. SYSU D00535]
MKKHLLFLIIMCFSGLLLNAQQLAFPGAEGFGRFATGGRNGSVYHVTNLNDSGPGSLRDAVSKSNRIVVFDVSGVIKIASRISVASNLTIAGQTAPGEGITVYGNGMSFSGASNTICRYIRIRMGVNGESGKDAVSIAGGTDMIFDHVSVSWGRDENFSISGDGSPLGRITIQNSIISQGLQTHSAGGLIQTNGGVTLFRNLYIDNKTRNPKVKGLNQFVNNIVYNWGNGGGYILGDSQGSSWATIVNNYFIEGPGYNYDGGKVTPTAPYTRANEYFQLYAAGNFLDNNNNGTLDGTESVKADYGPATWITDASSGWTSIPELHPVILSQTSAEDAYNYIVQHAGASLPVRDPVDSILMRELTSLGTQGKMINNETSLGLPKNVGNIFNAPKASDADNDGMPDSWENANGTNANADDAMIIGPDGYANIERYINSINSSITFLKYPVNLSISLSNPTTAVLKWTNVETNAKQIILEKSTDRVNYTAVSTFAADATTATLTVTADAPCYFRLKTADDTRQSSYSETVKIYDDVTKAGGGTLKGTKIFTPQEGKYYRIINYGSVAFNSGANFSGVAKYLNVTQDNLIGSTATFVWDNPTLLWEITDDGRGKGTYIIKNVGTGKYFGNVSNNNTTAVVNEPNGGYSVIFGLNQYPAQAGVADSVSFFRIHNGSNQLRPRSFGAQWFWSGGSTNRADMLYTFVPVSKEAVSLYLGGLRNLIAQATSLANEAQPGSDVLQYPPDAIAVLNQEIAAAQAFVDAVDYSSTLQPEVDNAVLALQSAVNNFIAAQIRTFANHNPQKLYNIFSYGTNSGSGTTSASASTARRYLVAIPNYNSTKDSLVYIIGKSDNDIKAGAVDVLQKQKNAQWIIAESEANPGFFIVKNKARGTYLAIDNYLSASPVEIYPYYQKEDNGKHAYSLQVSDLNTKCFNVGNVDATGKGGPLAFSTPADRTRLRWIFDETDVADDVAPDVITKNISIALNENGTATINPSQIDGGSSDNVGIVSMTLDKTTFDCSNIGANTVLLTVADAENNVSSKTAIVTVRDSIAPVQVQLPDVTGECSAAVTDIPTTTDGCAGTITGTTIDSLTYSTQGTHVITWRFDDGNGNVTTATQNVIVKDTTPPVALAKDINVTLVNGSATIAASAIDNGSNDACGLKSLTIDRMHFDCSNTGNNTVVLTVTDVNGNVSSTPATVNVIGVTPVVKIGVSRTDETFTGLDNKTIALGYGAQSLILTASDTTSANGSTRYNWSPATGLSDTNSPNPVFTPTAAGSYTFNVLATNEFGCTSSAAVTITVIDVRSGNKGNKVLVCHKTGSKSNPWTQVSIGYNAVAEHLSKGSYLGACTSPAAAKVAAIETSELSLNTLNVSSINTLSAYPNPFKTQTRVVFRLLSDHPNVSLDLYGLKGKVKNIYSGPVKAHQEYSFNYDTAIAPGVYFFLLSGSKLALSFKVIVSQ